MGYDYVKRTYPVNPREGEIVKHKETGKTGRVARENRSQSHYVMVRFDGQSNSLPCHPTALEYTHQR